MPPVAINQEYSSHGMSVPIRTRVEGGSPPAPCTSDPTRCGLCSRTASLAAVEVDGADAKHGPITMIPGVATDASPSARLTLVPISANTEAGLHLVA
jgi:hypothetical protein